jgi:hypothetical protein
VNALLVRGIAQERERLIGRTATTRYVCRWVALVRLKVTLFGESVAVFGKYQEGLDGIVPVVEHRLAA